MAEDTLALLDPVIDSSHRSFLACLALIMELKKHVLDLKGSLGSKFVACLALISSNNHTNSNRKAKI